MKKTYVFKNLSSHKNCIHLVTQKDPTEPYSFSLALHTQENPKEILAMAGGGFVGMSRIAKSSPNMWLDIFKQNKENLIEATEAFCKELETFKELAKNEEWDKMKEWIKKANKLHEIL